MAEQQLSVDIERSPFVTVAINGIKQPQALLAWQLSAAFSDVSHIDVCDVLQYLTTMEADTFLISVFNALAIGGTVRVRTDDFSAVVAQWQQAVWDEEHIRNPTSDARQAAARLFGLQRCGNPTQANYDQSYPDTFKSAYNQARLLFLLERAGFVQVDVLEQDGRLLATATKSMQRGERQIAKSLSGIRADHLNRYEFARDVLKTQQAKRVLDLACGIGYGTALLADALDATVTGVDIDDGAVSYARQYYQRQNNEFIRADAREIQLPVASFDAIVSFETVEHVTFDEALLKKFAGLLKANGTLVVSTPNQDVMPFDAEKFQYHVRHYTVAEFCALVTQAGFGIQGVYQQLDPHGGKVEPGDAGSFTILVCHKL